MSIEKILSDLDRHSRLFDLSQNGLGARLVDTAADGVAQSFTSRRSPDGTPWKELSSDYAKWKARHFPGRPQGVLEGPMRDGLPGERPPATESEAVYIYGTDDVQRDHCHWNSEGDALANRPPRPFVGLTDASRARSREILIDHLEGR